MFFSAGFFKGDLFYHLSLSKSVGPAAEPGDFIFIQIFQEFKRGPRMEISHEKNSGLRRKILEQKRLE
jgi:hypothetical protein